MFVDHRPGENFGDDDADGVGDDDNDLRSPAPRSLGLKILGT